MICIGCNRIMRESEMVRINWCLDCAKQAGEWEEDERRTVEAWRCKVCDATLPDHDIPLVGKRPEAGTYVCWKCRKPKNTARDLDYYFLNDGDHADSREHSEWWDRERKLLDQ
jgi:hypothetical protein